MGNEHSKRTFVEKGTLLKGSLDGKAKADVGEGRLFFRF